MRKERKRKEAEVSDSVTMNRESKVFQQKQKKTQKKEISETASLPVSHGSRCTKVNVNLSDPPEQGFIFFVEGFWNNCHKSFPPGPPWSLLLGSPF